MTSTADTIVWSKLNELLDCVEGELTAATCISVVVPGAQVVVDYCNPCDGDRCGMAWVRLQSVFPSTSFPIQDASATSCIPVMAYTVEIGVVRCCPVGDEEGNPPTKAEWEAATQQQLDDMTSIQRAVQCCFGNRKVVFGAYQPIGPEGGCVGGLWAVAADPLAWTT